MNLFSWWTFWNFFSARGRGKGSPRSREGGGDDFLLKIPGGGGGLPGGWGWGGVPAESVPLHNHLCTKAFGFADAQVDLALAEIEKGFSLAQQREAAYSKCRVGSRLH